MKSTIRQYGIVFLLLLAFFQQIGAGLYIHNLVHNNRERHNQHNEASREINFACSCVDNFFTPFTETVELTVERPVRTYAVIPGYFREEICLSPATYSSLRGPPVFIG